MLKVIPANPKLLAKPMGVEVKTKSGLFIPGKVFGQDLELARIISVSSEVNEMKNPRLVKDSIVLINRHSGFDITYQEETMKLITNNDIHAYVELDDEGDLSVETQLPADLAVPEVF